MCAVRSLSSSPRLKFAVMVDQLETLQQWQYDTIKAVLETGRADLTAIIHNTENFNPRVGTLWQRLPKVFNAWSWYVRTQRSPQQSAKSIKELIEGVPVLAIDPQVKGRFVHRFQEKDIARVRELGLDFIIRFGFRIIKGEMLEAAKFGIWSYHHNDNRKYRGTPGGFWEIYYDDNVTGAILQRLTERLDAGEILYRGSMQTQKQSYGANIDQSLRMSAPWCAAAASYVHLHGALPPPDRAPSSSVIHKAPNNGQMCRFFLRLGDAYWQRLKKRFFLGYWNVGIAQHSPAELLRKKSLGKITFSPLCETGRFIADPFFLSGSENLRILAEDFYYGEKGTICALPVDDSGKIGAPEAFLKEPFHLSYPFVFQEGEETWMIPECCEAGGLKLYQVRDGKPVLKTTLMAGERMVDPTILKHDGRIWLFYGREGDNHAALYIAYADQLEGPWTPHPLNPVKCDVRSARPGGTIFEVDGELYRPAQDCAKKYGHGLTINQITRLSTEDYAEEPLFTLHNVDPAYPDGVHHMAVYRDKIVIDAKRESFSIKDIMNKCMRRLWRR